MRSNQPSGKVWLIGAGPGDPDLLTVKAVRALNSANLVLFDQLVSPEIRALFPQSVPALYVGKVKGNHSVAQKDLNKLLVKQALAGKTVCRVKGGDPLVFGRGGEELLALRRAGVDAEIIPGITSASGCAASANIPLTHRGLAQGCTFITAHGEHDLQVNWQALAALDHTLVIYMGVSRAQMIQSQLLVAGACGDTPVAVVENGCRSNQRVVTGKLAELVELIVQHKIHSPALIVVGRVVSLAAELSPGQWLESIGAQPEKLTA